MEKPHRRRVAIYARTSTPKQASVPTQVELCRKSAEFAECDVRYILKEEGFSAKTIERPKVRQLMTLVEQQRIDLVIVWRLDRLVRSLRDLLNIHEFLEAHGVGLMSATEPFSTETSFGKFTFRQVASFAELERDTIAERSRMGKYTQALAGRWPTQEPPLGYRLGRDRRLAINEAEATVVRRVFRQYAKGLAITEITRQLGVARVVSRDGRSVAPRWVAKMLRNPIYFGKMVVLGEVHARPDLRLIGPALEKKVEERRKKVVRDGLAGRRRAAAADALVADYLAHLADPMTASEPWRPPTTLPASGAAVPS